MNTAAHQRLLIERIRALSHPMNPLPTGVRPKTPKLGPLRAVLFDVYGTLFISGSGDISLANPSHNVTALAEALAESGFLTKNPQEAARIGARLFVEEIERVHAARRAEGIAFPEVDVRRIWRAALMRLQKKSPIRGELADARIERLAVEYECRVNPVWPMPGALDALEALRGAGILLGIVSNAQFFTPLLFEAFWEKPPVDLGFDLDLCFWSWETLEAKPGDALFGKKAAEKLVARGIAPGETLYVGNDMRNDVLPAARAGFRTALFAGDKRSLRLREDDADCADIAPDAVVTEWGQVVAFFPGLKA